jgi:hypothetical protein
MDIFTNLFQIEGGGWPMPWAKSGNHLKLWVSRKIRGWGRVRQSGKIPDLTVFFVWKAFLSTAFTYYTVI